MAGVMGEGTYNSKGEAGEDKAVWAAGVGRSAGVAVAEQKKRDGRSKTAGKSRRPVSRSTKSPKKNATDWRVVIEQFSR